MNRLRGTIILILVLLIPAGCANEGPRPGYALSEKGIDIFNVTKEDIPVLIKCLSLPDRDDRRAAGRSLARLGYFAVEPLMDVASGKKYSQEAQMEAIKALGCIGSSAKEAIPLLIKALNNDHRGIQYTAARSLGELREHAIPSLITEAANAETHSVKIFVETFTFIGPDAVEYLIELLSSDSEVARLIAVKSLGELGSKSYKAVPRLMELLQASDSHSSAVIMETLSKIGMYAIHSLELIMDFVDDEDPEIRLSALKTIGSIISAHSRYMIVYSARVSNNKTGLKMPTTDYLRKADSPSDEEVFACIESLARDSDERVRVQLLTTLKMMGIDRHNLLTYVKAALHDDSKTVRGAAIQSIPYLGIYGSLLLPRLRELGISFVTRFTWLDCMEDIIIAGIKKYDYDEEALPALAVAMEDRSPYIREAACIAAGELGVKASAALELLTDIAENDPFRDFYSRQYIVREAATEAIEKIKAS